MSGEGGGYSYQQRSAARAQWDATYERLLSGLQLDPMDRAQLRARGLTDQIIDRAGYRTKPANNDQQFQRCLHTLESSGHSLASVPGFYLNEKNNRRTCIGAQGVFIPSRDLSGGINSLVIRRGENDSHRGKYIAFSSPKKLEGGSARNTTHCPITHSFADKAAMGTTLRITEGVLKADVACALDPAIYTLGIPGLNAPEDLKWVLQQLEVSRILLAFDMEATVDVQNKRVKLLQMLAADYDVTFEEWAPEFKGIDDALLKAKETIHQLSVEELNDRIKSSTELDPATSGYVYIIQTKTFVHMEDLTELDDQQFARTHGMEGVAAVNELLSASNTPYFPRYHGVEFWPGQAKTFMSGRLAMFNLWRPPEYEPEEGDISPLLNHMEYMLPEERERNILLQWMAHQAQHLGEKIHWAVLLQGEPGIGKSFLGNVMAAILGKHNISRPTNTELHETFTSWEKQCSLVIVEEVMAAGRLELMNKLKPKITEPQTRIREMHKASYEQPNRYNMLMLTNHEDAIIIDESDRRYFVLNSKARHQNEQYYHDLFEWVNKPAAQAAMLYWALHYPLTGFNAKGHAPKTEARTRLINSSRSRLEEYVLTGIEERRWPFTSDIISVSDLKESRIIPGAITSQSERAWGAALTLAGAVKLPQQINVGNGIRKRLWAIRRPEIWLNNDMKTERVAEEYNKWVGSGQPGGNPLDEIAPMGI